MWLLYISLLIFSSLVTNQLSQKSSLSDDDTLMKTVYSITAPESCITACFLHVNMLPNAALKMQKQALALITAGLPNTNMARVQLPKTVSNVCK